MKTIALGTMLLITCLLSCKKDDAKIEDSKYSGVFRVDYSSGDLSGTTTIELKNSEYKCSANPDHIPAGGSGKYSMKDGKIIFSDENFWTADFDWNLILKGEYKYSFDGNKLEIWAERSTGEYRYVLQKK